MSVTDFLLWCLFWIIFIPFTGAFWVAFYVVMEFAADNEKAKLKYGIKDE